MAVGTKTDKASPLQQFRTDQLRSRFGRGGLVPGANPVSPVAGPKPGQHERDSKRSPCPRPLPESRSHFSLIRLIPQGDGAALESPSSLRWYEQRRETPVWLSADRGQ